MITNSHLAVVGSTLLALCMGIFVMFMRIKGQKKPVSAKKILIPPIAMSSGALMFIFPEFRLTPLEIVEAVIVGMVFSTVLIATSKFEIRDNEIYMKRSKLFFFIIVALLIIRTVWKSALSNSFEPGELAGMFWLLAFSMLCPWRIAMFIKYKKIQKAHILQ